MRWDEVEERNLVLVHNLVKKILPEVERTGLSLGIGSVYFEPVVKRKGGNNEREVVGIKISSGYDWTSISKVMMKPDGSIDASKLKNKVKEMQDTIKDVFDKHNKKSIGENMKLAERVIEMYEQSTNDKIGGKYVVTFFRVNSHLSLLLSYLKFINADENIIKEVSKFKDSIDMDGGMPKLEEDELVKILIPMQPMWTNVVEYLQKNHDFLKGTVRIRRTKIEPDKIVANVAGAIKKMMGDLKQQGFDINKMRKYQ